MDVEITADPTISLSLKSKMQPAPEPRLTKNKKELPGPRMFLLRCTQTDRP